VKYLTTTDPHAEAREIEAPCGSAAVMELLGTSHGDRDHVIVYVRPQRPQEWDVFSCVRHGASWSAPFLSYVQVADDEVERLRAELREVRAQWQETLRAERERVRTACVAACRRVESEHGDPYEPVSIGREEGAAECAGAIAALDLDALPENAPPR